MLRKDEAKTNRVVRKIRTHISDTYRIHRRMLRNRRDAVEDVIFDRSIAPKLEYDIDERVYDIHELLENWRTTAPKKAEYQRLFLLLFRAGGTWSGMLRSVIAARLNGKVPTELVQEFGTTEIENLTQTPIFAGEEELLNKLHKILQQASEDGDKIELLKIVVLYRFAEQFQLQSFRSDIKKLQERVKQRIDRPYTDDKLPKIVIFTSFTKTCSEIVKQLQACFGEKSVVSHQSGKQRTVIEKHLNQFKSDPNCFILVCDQSGEEGHNLQFADWMIHFDLPWSPNRLEQRIGRIDRIGRPIKVDFTLFPGAEIDDSPHDAWYRLLKEGFQIFDKSIASLQFYVEEKLTQLEAILFASGANGLIEQIDIIQTEIKSEIVKINEQNVLDEIDFHDENASEYWKALDDYDAKHKEMERAFGGWFLQALRFQETSNPNNPEIRRYQPTTRTLVPADRIKSVFGRSLTNSGTYNRRVANVTKSIHLYRIGEPLVDAAGLLRSSGMIEDKLLQCGVPKKHGTNPRVQSGSVFRFNYIVETNLELAKQILLDTGEDKTKLKNLQRRTDALLPPRIESIFVDARTEELSIVEDEALLSILQRPYFGKKGKEFRDYNLSKGRLAVLNEFIDASKWENFCRNARQNSESLLRKCPKFVDICQQSASLTQGKLQNRLNQLRLRLEQLQTKQASTSLLAEELKNETRLSSAILQGIQKPSMKLDSVGFIIVAGHKPVDFGERMIKN
ncbi:MAG: SWF/SNF helicase family protein [Calothrix sp. SM1_7_51]|nr:SWF/SNF helicase family protein [Calothrix sp. SM1_7_51]